MAKATAKTRDKVVQTTVKVPDGITLELSDQEAKSLFVLLHGAVGGSPYDTARKYTTPILEELKKVYNEDNFDGCSRDAFEKKLGNAFFSPESLKYVE